MITRQRPKTPHTNPLALREGTADYAFTHRTLGVERGRYRHSEQELHDHYERNALACGHSPECLKVTLPVNWPTMFGHPLCTCGHGEPWIHPRHRADVEAS
jgi:hypothetical protein